MNYCNFVGEIRSASLMELLSGLKEHPRVPEGMAWQDKWYNLKVISFREGKSRKG